MGNPYIKRNCVIWEHLSLSTFNHQQDPGDPPKTLLPNTLLLSSFLLSSLYDWSYKSIFLQCPNHISFLHLSSSPHPLPLQAECIFPPPVLPILSRIPSPNRSLGSSPYVLNPLQRRPSTLGGPVRKAGITPTTGRSGRVIRRFASPLVNFPFRILTPRF